MFKLHPVLAASAALMIAASAPAFAQDSLTLRSILVASIGHDVDAVSDGKRTNAKILRAAHADMPPFEQRANIGGTAQIEVDLDANGTLTEAAVYASSGHARLDQSALRAARASTYQSATINGHAVGGRYVVEVVFDPSL
jgi:TonB family protein